MGKGIVAYVTPELLEKPLKLTYIGGPSDGEVHYVCAKKLEATPHQAFSVSPLKSCTHVSSQKLCIHTYTCELWDGGPCATVRHTGFKRG